LLHGHVRAFFEEADLFKHAFSPHSDVDGGGFSLMARLQRVQSSLHAVLPSGALWSA
jgi:hypothetical protein